MMRLTRAGVALAGCGFTLLALGLGMGNVELLILSAFPLVLVALALTGRSSEDASGPIVARRISTTVPRRGDSFEMHVESRGGPDIVEVHAPLPTTFVLEEGTNVAMLTRGRAVAWAMRLRASARGQHALPPVTAEAIDPAGLLAPRVIPAAPAVPVEVAPRSHPIARVRGRQRLAEGFQEKEARLGVDSTDFRELRDYAWGDPPNAINWKATARRLSAMGRRGGRQAHPLVNEYEKEGKRTVFVLLDGGATLRVGTSLETGLDHAVEASLGTARLFLSRGSRVGAATFGARAGAVAPPEAGSGQAPSLERALAPGDIDAESTLPRMLRTLAPYLTGARPILVIVTRVTPRNAAELAESARRFRALTGERRRRLPILVLDVRALELAPALGEAWSTARELVEREDAMAAGLVEDVGARVVAWRPTTDLRRALRKGGIV